MNTNLAFKNVKKSFKDYAIYFFTLVIGVMVFYMFNSIYAQKELMSFSDTVLEMIKVIETLIGYLSIFVAVILGFLIVYINNFFIKRRKKELGLYMLLGMTKNKISKIIITETFFIAIIALFVGLIFGVIGSQFMSVLTAKLFEADMMDYKFVFAKDAITKSILYFGIIFIVVGIFNVFNIGRCKLIDLIYGDRKNEELKLKNNKTAVFIFILSIITLIIGYICITLNNFENVDTLFQLSIIFGTLGTFLFFFSISTILLSLIKSNKNLYFKGLNMFILRQLASKINTNFVSISIICLINLIVIGATTSGLSFQNSLSNVLIQNTNYNISIYKFDNYLKNEGILPPSKIYDKMPASFKNFEAIESYNEFSIYTKENLKMNVFNIDFDEKYQILNERDLNFIKLSDFNNILNQRGLKPYTLQDNEYILTSTNNNTMKDIGKKIARSNNKLVIDNNQFELKEYIEDFSVYNTSYQNLIVINDKFFDKDFYSLITILNINTKTEEDEIVLCDILNEIYKQDKTIFDNMSNKKYQYESFASTKALIAFIGIYVGIVFIITCSTILAIQQISEITDNKYRYNLLSNLGAEKSMLNRALFIQILIYFLAPLLLAIVHSIVGLNVAINVIQKFGDVYIFKNVIITSVFILIVYGIYFLLTYISSKNIINK